MKISKIIKLALVIIMATVIFLFSHQTAKTSLNTSDQVIINTAEIIKGEELTKKESDSIVKKYKVFVRKSAHFFLFFALAITIFIYLTDGVEVNKRYILYTMIACIIYAITDEIHQLFVDGRTARIFDVFVDSCGSLSSTMIMYGFHKLKNTFKK